MIRNCKNCAGRILYNIELGKLKCESCGSGFDVKEYTNDKYDIGVDEIEYDVYICKTCGAEVAINGTEASTACVYCGNPTVVFSRVAKEKRPEIIIPFQVTKEQAEKSVRKLFNKGFFIPKEVKEFTVDYMRGIYIPYYVTQVEYDGSFVISIIESRGKNSKVTLYFLRSLFASMPWVTTDATSKLSDSVSQRLEPFDIESAKPFDEDYLLGFYSNIANVESDKAMATAKSRVRELVTNEVYGSIQGRNKTVEKSRHTVEVYEEPVKAMLPAWFLTYKYKNQTYTMLVNGQTGKVVGGAPYSKPLFFTCTAILSALIVGILEFLFYVIHSSLYAFVYDYLFMYIGILIIALVPPFVIRLNKTYKAIKRSSEQSLASFVMKRQGDEK